MSESKKKNNTQKKSVDVSELLLKAVKENKEETIRMLIEAGADVNIRNEKDSDNTLLMEAIYRCDDLEIIKKILDAGAKKEEKNKYGKTALICASSVGKIEFVNLLLRYGADINAKNKNGVTSLLIAYLNNHKNIVDLLLDRGADVNISDKLGNAFLMYLGVLGLDFFDKAIKAGADVNAKNKKGKTALFSSVEYCLYQKQLLEKVKKLIKAGADVNIPDKCGNTPLMMSIKNNDVETVKMLINAGADVNAVNKKTYSVFDIARENGNAEIILLIKRELDKKKQTKDKEEKVIKTKKSKDVFNSIKNNIQDKRLKNLLLKRIEKGISSYGTRLTTYNGRDALKDAHEEVLDAILYIWQKKMEVSSKDEETLHKLLWILNNLFYAEDVIKELRESPSEKKERIDKFCDALNKISLFK
jgi:ankyrin repeat protein